MMVRLKYATLGVQFDRPVCMFTLQKVEIIFYLFTGKTCSTAIDTGKNGDQCFSQILKKLK